MGAIRLGLSQVFSSRVYTDWASKPINSRDAVKIASEFRGVRRPQAGSLYARGLIDLCRLDPPIIPVPKPTSNNIFATKSGIFLRTPDGNAETKAREARALSYEWVAINVGDFPDLTAWRNITMPTPWARVRTVADIEKLVSASNSLGGSRLIVNLEDEAKDVLTPATVAIVLDSLVPPSTHVGLSVPGWLYNDVNWVPLRGYPALLQVFTGEVPSLKGALADCIEHAHDEGFLTSRPTWQAYATNDVRPDPEPWEGVFSIYCGDDVRDWSKFPPPVST